MAIAMTQRVGRVGVFGGLGSCVLFACGLLSCGTAEAGTQLPAESDTSRAAVPAVTTEPQQVVQRMVPAGAAVAVATGAASSSPGSKPAAPTSDGPRRPAEAITPKHLEAELNRLEAELGK
jgi:hypothetical protein